jgi:hypothetical protein
MKPNNIAPTCYPVLYRTYTRKDGEGRESFEQAKNRAVDWVSEVGKLSRKEKSLIEKAVSINSVFPSGRVLWCGGTEWIDKPENYHGAFNCTSTEVTSWEAMADMMALAMMGCGTGAVIEPRCIDLLPTIKNELAVEIVRDVGAVPNAERLEVTTLQLTGNVAYLNVGDSRQGWVKAYLEILRLSSQDGLESPVTLKVDLGNVRPSGERLKGFGGVSNPIKLAGLFGRIAEIVNGAIGRQLTSKEVCLLIDEAALVVVAGNVRRSAGMRQGGYDDLEFVTAKDNLWINDNGNWKIDPKRDALRMANHTRVSHTKPSLEDCINAVSKQFYSGEGAIQWAGEAVWRANQDILKGTNKRRFIDEFQKDKAVSYMKEIATQSGIEWTEYEENHRPYRYGLNPCGEIVGKNYHCNLAEVHLNTIRPP